MTTSSNSIYKDSPIFISRFQRLWLTKHACSFSNALLNQDHKVIQGEQPHLQRWKYILKEWKNGSLKVTQQISDTVQPSDSQSSIPFARPCCLTLNCMRVSSSITSLQRSLPCHLSHCTETCQCIQDVKGLSIPFTFV